jgi:hypothetical protein
VLCLIPVGLLVDRLGSKTVNAAGIARADPYGHGHGRVDELAGLESGQP